MSEFTTVIVIHGGPAGGASGSVPDPVLEGLRVGAEPIRRHGDERVALPGGTGDDAGVGGLVQRVAVVAVGVVVRVVALGPATVAGARQVPRDCDRRADEATGRAVDGRVSRRRLVGGKRVGVVGGE